jgi:hypothetical protein
MRIAVASTIVLLFAAATLAQTREAGPWWPNPAWGPGDQAGASNWVTPEKVLEAVRLVKTGKIYEIGQVYEKGMPMFGQRTYTLLSPASPTYAFPTANRIVGNDEFVCGEIGQVGTQFGSASKSRAGWSPAGPRWWGAKFPVQQELIMKNGFNIENLTLEELARDAAYEFLFVFTPVRFKGATGSPGRPLAIR